MTTPLVRGLALLLLAFTAASLHAQVPQLINYQGRVAVGTENFNGSGQFRFALVNAAGSVSFWSNDGTSVAGSQPTAAVTLAVTKGLYSVLLGDTTLAGMTVAIPASVWSNAEVRLRVWFNDGVNGSQLLTPDTRLAPNGYLPDGAVSSAKLTPNLVLSGANLQSSSAAAAGGVSNTTDNPAALTFTTPFRTWWMGQNKPPDAIATVDQFFIYDQNANATRLRIDTAGVIYGNGAGLTNVAATVADGSVTSAKLAPGAAAANLGSDPPSTVLPVLGMTWIKGGRFLMGSPASDPADIADERPQTWVTISSGFWMGAHEVTQREYLAVMGSNPSGFTGNLSRPVENVTWANANTYCSTLTTSERTAGRLPAGWGYRLPTEAEWEYCCRAGPRTTIFSHGDDWDTTAYGNYAWFSGNAASATHPVEQKLPNAWGLSDMHGNVWEWVKDFYNATQYPGGSVTDPQGPVSGTNHVVRGGSWVNIALLSRCAQRFQIATTGNFVGFRVVLSSGVP
ncbi:MAG: formylglycine-generating enzyme family protein [Verrucomicrobiaceae bacterium]|nr:formylglycine-generating enzyme family protein [Verrucomicrobiaceae bacterium]